MFTTRLLEICQGNNLELKRNFLVSGGRAWMTSTMAASSSMRLIKVAICSDVLSENYME